jgi:hypothetical protein
VKDEFEAEVRGAMCLAGLTAGELAQWGPQRLLFQVDSGSVAAGMSRQFQPITGNPSHPKGRPSKAAKKRN